MSLQLLDIDPEVDFPDLTRCLLEAYEDPHQKFLHIYLPIFGPGPEARKAALEEASTRLKRWHSEDPSSHWQKIVDTTTGRIVAGASWNIHTSNPFAEPQEEEVTWFPNDTSRTFAEKALENYATPRFKAGQRPHVCRFSLNSLVLNTPYIAPVLTLPEICSTFLYTQPIVAEASDNKL